MLGFGQCKFAYELEGSSLVIKTDSSKKSFELLANGVYKGSEKSGDKWWVKNNVLFILYNEYITYQIDLESISKYGSWNNIAGRSGKSEVLSKNFLRGFSEISVCIKNYVEKKINKWQKKDDFEKLAQYQKRVTKYTRNQQIKLYQLEAIDFFKSQTIDMFYINEIELQKYDSENETFLLKISDTESFLLPVPINEARIFSDSYNPMLFSNLDMVIKDDAFILSHIEYNKLYSYDITDDNSYAVTTFDYNFDEIDIDIKQSNFSNTTTTKNKTIRVGNSFVDSNIPKNKKVNNRYALVIGNEDYSSYQRTLNSEQNVDYAENDATIFKRYCLNTLGVKQDNMHFLLNATAGQMSQEIDLVSKIVSKLGPDAELIVYYAGHGYPDELTKVPYLIPVDVSASNLSSALKLSDLYSKLSDTKASKVTIFLDACFTGGGRTSGLVASRGVKVRPKEGSLSGNLIVFSASSGDQSSLPYHKEAHGMFTYHVLKKLQESEGNVSMGELSDYLVDSVSIRSLKENEKEQDPNVNISQEVIDDWINWKF
tara:strand:- start:353 stop:1975 length:1623 start_codon:yes stop_codon:yes gene_type:complete